MFSAVMHLSGYGRALGTEVDLGPGQSRERGTAAPLCSAMSLVAMVAHLSYCLDLETMTKASGP